MLIISFKVGTENTIGQMEQDMHKAIMEKMGQVEQQEMAEQMAQAKIPILMLLPQLLLIKQLLIN
ncbi:hypothetical protein IP364_05000 [Helicobacter winghamensis]|uniref:hypothetical protein n=1 Tax=Helicobacter winghamensis TaxID=157268 RepID=UPI00279F2128